MLRWEPWLARFTATDADAGDTHSYSIVAGDGDTDNASFAISGNTLVIAEAARLRSPGKLLGSRPRH